MKATTVMVKNSDADEPKTMDIAKSKSAPSETSRPIIVKNKGMMGDPMVKNDTPVSEDKKAESEEPKELNAETPATTKKTIQPLSPANEKPIEEEANEASQLEAQPASDQSENPETTNSSSSPEEEAKKQQDAIVDAVVGQAGGKSDDPIEAPDQQDQRQQHINKLTNEKTYFLPIGQITRRKQNKQAAIVLIMLIVLAGAYIAADMGVINLPFELPVSFFSK